MTVRKRRVPTAAGFGMPQPYNPLAAQHADIKTLGVFPYCAMMQVAAKDTYTDYVICRGFDIRINKFIDYEEGDSDKPGIAVAKPFGNRVKCYYQVGQIYPAVLPYQVPQSVPVPIPSDIDWRVGQNPGVASEACAGQPQSLDQAVTELTGHTGEYVNWQLIDSGPVFLWAVLGESLSACGEAEASVLEVDADGEWCDSCPGLDLTVSDPFGVVAGSALASGGSVPIGTYVLAMRVSSPEVEDDSAASVCQWAAVTFGSGECCESPSSPGSEGSPSSPSSPSSQSSQPSPSSGSEPSPSEPSGESKSSAIVPATWTEDGYTALFTMEAPGVDFTDTICVTVTERDTEIDIDERFLEVCERDTIVCTGAQPNRPVLVGAEVGGAVVQLRFAEQLDDEVKLVISLRGTRKDFKDVRFPSRTREQFEANERFLKSAYPGA